jgi:hypothetical protein
MLDWKCICACVTVELCYSVYIHLCRTLTSHLLKDNVFYPSLIIFYNDILGVFSVYISSAPDACKEEPHVRVHQKPNS